MTSVVPRLVAAALAAVTGSADARAGASPFCGKAGAADRPWVETRLLGAWEIEYHPGFARVSGPQGTMTHDVPDSENPEPVTIEVRGGQLMATYPDMPAPLVLRGAGGDPWTFVDAGAPKLPLAAGPDAAARTAGCPQTMLPRLTGTSQLVEDGRTVDFTYWLMVLDAGRIWGLAEARIVAGDTSIVTRRVVGLRRP